MLPLISPDTVPAKVAHCSGTPPFKVPEIVVLKPTSVYPETTPFPSAPTKPSIFPLNTGASTVTLSIVVANTLLLSATSTRLIVAVYVPAVFATKYTGVVIVARLNPAGSPHPVTAMLYQVLFVSWAINWTPLSNPVTSTLTFE